MLKTLNSPTMYLICGAIVLFVAGICVFFMIRAWRAGIAIGMDKTRMKRTVTSSATFAVLPSLGILLGVIALSGALGTPLPWLRLSVIGALHYETQVAEAAAEAAGLSGLSISEMTPKAFVTIAFLMAVCIMWGMVFSVFFNKKYLKKLSAGGAKTASAGGFGDVAMTAMFIGLVSAYIGSYIGSFVSGNGLFSFKGSWMPLLVAGVSAAVMALFIWIEEKKKAEWVEGFALAASMLAGMAAAAIAAAL